MLSRVDQVTEVLAIPAQNSDGTPMGELLAILDAFVNLVPESSKILNHRYDGQDDNHTQEGVPQPYVDRIGIKLAEDQAADTKDLTDHL